MLKNRSSKENCTSKSKKFCESYAFKQMNLACNRNESEYYSVFSNSQPYSWIGKWR